MLRLKARWLVGAALAGSSVVLATGAGTASASAPPVPPSCSTTAIGFTNTTPVAIPDASGATQGSITSTIAVTGAGTRLEDVDVLTNITHTAPTDLDVTITSPAGTTVTLTTDNGGTSDNVFAGTRWDDIADPGSQVPYAFNPIIVSDHTYANLTPVPDLTPEEALAAFRGENPNGTWTLKVNDDQSMDTGTLNSWGLDLRSESPSKTKSGMFQQTTPLAIPDNNTTGVTSTIVVSGAGTYLSDLDVIANITHTFNTDIDMTITSPVGRVVTLGTDNGGGLDNVFAGTHWDDDADPGSPIPYPTGPPGPNITTDHVYTDLTVAPNLTPEEPLGAFIGENPNGTWTMKVIDDSPADVGTLNSWSLAPTTATCVNVAPVLDAIGDRGVAEGDQLAFTLAATDGDGDPLTYSATNLPPGANFDASTQQFSWTPGFDQAGAYGPVHFDVTDGLATDSEDIAITVGNTNRAPVLDPVGDRSVAEGKPLSFTVSGSDPDGDALSFSAANLPKGAKFDPATRGFSWTPTFRQAGSHPGVHFEVSDGSATGAEDVTFDVTNVKVTTKTSVKVKRKRKKRKPVKLVVSGRVAPAQAGLPVKVTLSRKGLHGGFKVIKKRKPREDRRGRYGASFKRPKPGACKVTSKFAGSSEAAGSSASKLFSC